MTTPRTDAVSPPLTDGGGRRPRSVAWGPRAGARGFVTPLVMAVLAAFAVGLVAVAVRGPANYSSGGFGYPHWPTALATAALRIGADLAGAVTVGALAFAALCTAPTRRGHITVDGYAAVSLARRAAPIWAVCAVLLTPMSAANTVGQPISRLAESGHLAAVITQTLPSRGWLVAALVCTVVAVAVRSVLTVAGVVGVGLLAGLALVPPVVVGNAGEGLGHDVDTTAIVLHVLAVAVWFGATVAAWDRLRRRASGPGSAGAPVSRVGRESATGPESAIGRVIGMTVICGVAAALSGLALGANMIAPSQLLTTQYGALAVAKTGGVILVAAATVWALGRRRRGARAGARRAGPRSAGRLRWWLSIQIVLLGAGLGASVAMAQQPAAAFLVQPTTPSSQQLGFTLPEPPTAESLVMDWRFDLLLGTAGILAAALYLGGVLRVRRAGRRWPSGRTVAFLAGCACLVLATSSGVAAYGEAAFSVHMAAHMIATMVVPVLLVLGGPVTLVRECCAPAESGRAAGSATGLAPGPADRLGWLIGSWPVRVLTNPFAAVTIYAALLFGLYLTPIFGYVVGYHWFHELAMIAFLVTGYFLYWQIVGIDPLPHRIPHLARLGLVVVLMPIDAVFGIAILTKQSVMGLVFYGYLSLPWLPDQLSDQRLGALIAWIGGEIPLLAVVVTLMVQWWRAGGLGPADTSAATASDPGQLAWEEFTRSRARRQ